MPVEPHVDRINRVLWGTPEGDKPGLILRFDRVEQAMFRQSKITWLLIAGFAAVLIERGLQLILG